MKRALLLMAVLAALLATPRATEARVIGRAGEINLGRETASLVEELFAVDRDPVAVARVRAIGRRLVSVADDADLPFEFHVIEEPEVNAFALPGGFIYIYRGLLQLLPNDDALAFVMGHELAHAVEHHSIQQFEKALGISILLQIGLGSSHINAQQLVQVILSSKFSRTDESAADRIGIRYVAAAGYNPESAVEAMEVIRRITQGDRPPALLATHPAPAQRVRSLANLAEKARAEQQAAALRRPDAGPPPQIAPTTPLRSPAGGEMVVDALFPLISGARWEYVVHEGNTALATRFSIWEEVRSEPRGVFRASWDFGRGVGSDELIAATEDRLLSRPLTAPIDSPWRTELLLLPDAAAELESGSLRSSAVERVEVRAGAFEAIRVEQLDASGAVVRTRWFAPGVGLVKQVAGGVTLELESYRLPKPLVVEAPGDKSSAAGGE